MNARLAAILLRAAFAANGFRLALTLSCIALGVALAGAVHTVHTSALAEIDRAARALSGSADVEVRGPRSGFDDALFAVIANQPDVAVASPLVEVEAAFADRPGTLRVLGIDALRAARLQPALVSESSRTGAPRAATLLDPAALWISPAAAARLALREGDGLRLVAGNAPREFRVAGVLAGMDAAGELGVIDIAAAQSRFERVGRLSRVDVRLRPGTDPRRFRDSLAAILPAGVVASGAASIAGRAADISRAYRVNLDALALVALATGAFLVFSTLALQAARRRQEFALLRALGVTRRGVASLLALEGAIMGTIGAAIGTLIGLAGSREVLARAGGDLGAGFFGAERIAFTPDAGALALIAALGVGMSVAGALWVARAAGRIGVAEALRDRAVDLPSASDASAWPAIALFALGIPLLFVPPIAGLPLAGYGAIAAWLAGSVLAVGPACRALLRIVQPREAPIVSLALAQVRQLPGHLAASVAGIVVSASLCVAMAIMVFSFRVSLEDWLTGVVGADLYVRSSSGASAGYFSLEEQQRVAALAEVASIDALRQDHLALDAQGPPLSLIARPINPRVLAGFRAEPPDMPAPGAEIPVWISEAARDLYGWKPGDRIALPIEGRSTTVRVAGVIRDYARTWGAVLMPVERYRALTGDTRANDLAIHLRPGVDSTRAQAAVRAALPQAHALEFEDAAGLRRRSLAIFDRSFAVTYALEAIAVVIGLAGVTSSFAALAWSRRREFGVLRFLGLNRREILGLLALEGAATGALGAAIGLASGVAISLVLLRVVNRQSFHWSLTVHWPIAALAALVGSIVALCALGARVSGALAVRNEAVLAVKDDA
ncbi:MAG: FtsX-like permease family protein [Usitatibacter sp.]